MGSYLGEAAAVICKAEACSCSRQCFFFIRLTDSLVIDELLSPLVVQPSKSSECEAVAVAR